MMSVDEFDRLRGRRHIVLDAVALSDDILAEMQQVADKHPADDADLGLVGGLMEEEGGRQPAKPR